MWERALEYMALHGAAPHVVGGDLNFVLDDLHKPHPSHGCWPPSSRSALVDADVELVAVAGAPPPPLSSYLGPGI